jgi:hypothetical protein
MAVIQLILALISLSLTLPSAQALEATLLGGLNYAAPTQRASGVDYRWTGKESVIWGLSVSHPTVILPFDIESGVLVQTERSERETTTGPVLQTARHLQIPLLFRFYLDANISFAAGGFVGLIQNQLQENNDSGLLIGARANFYLPNPFSFILDARYQHGLANRATVAGDTFNTRSVQILAGLQIHLLD